MTKIYAVVNQKGGVGKTTTVINLGAYLASKGRRVLIADIDPQANATSGIGVNKYDLQMSMYNLLLEETAAADVTHPLPDSTWTFCPLIRHWPALKWNWSTRLGANIGCEKGWKR